MRSAIPHLFRCSPSIRDAPVSSARDTARPPIHHHPSTPQQSNFAYLNSVTESPSLPSSPLLTSTANRPRLCSIRLLRQPLPPTASLLDPATRRLPNFLAKKVPPRSNGHRRLPVCSPQLPDLASAEILILPWQILLMEGPSRFPLVTSLPPFPFALPGGRSRTVPTLFETDFPPVTLVLSLPSSCSRSGVKRSPMTPPSPAPVNHVRPLEGE